MYTRALIFLLLAMALPAVARNPDGTLGLLITPNDGVPALLAGEVSFEATATAESALTIIRDGQRWPVAVTWSPLPGGRFRGQCTAPTDLPHGLYALEAAAGDALDRTPRALAVLPPPGDVYTFVHLSDTHIGSERHKRPSRDILRDCIAAVNQAGAAFCVITGDLTQSGLSAEFQGFLEQLDGCQIPTFVCPGNHDREALNYERFFGPLVYTFTFGRDAFLSFDTKDFYTAPDLGPQPGDIELARRVVQPARWRIGLTHRYEPNQGMRSQLSLFVDAPLDYLLFGHWHRENTPEERGVPWGRTRISVVPAGIDGKLRVIDATPQGLHLRPVETVAATE